MVATELLWRTKYRLDGTPRGATADALDKKSGNYVVYLSCYDQNMHPLEEAIMRLLPARHGPERS